jgi:ACT domain-containing protein
MQNKPLIPIVIALIISIACGFILMQWMNFFAGFGLALVVQFIVGAAMNQFLQVKTSLEMEKQLNMVEQIVPIRLDQPNFYKCINCEKNINVALTAKTAMMTEIIDVEASHNQMVQTINQLATTDE